MQDVVFSKHVGLEISDMARSEWGFKKLRNFRAGIEAGISWIKRVFGLTRCTWKVETAFKSYVWARAPWLSTCSFLRDDSCPPRSDVDARFVRRLPRFARRAKAAAWAPPIALYALRTH